MSQPYNDYDRIYIRTFYGVRSNQAIADALERPSAKAIDMYAKNVLRLDPTRNRGKQLTRLIRVRLLEGKQDVFQIAREFKCRPRLVVQVAMTLQGQL